MAKNVPLTKKETEFALTALMEVPTQYKATIELGILGYGEAFSYLLLISYVGDCLFSPLFFCVC